MELFYDVALNELKHWLEEHGEPSYRAAQIFEWAYQNDVRSFEDMTNLPKPLRDALAQDFSIGPYEPIAIAEDPDTHKILIAMPDGGEVECVAMGMEGYKSACLSTQVGCAVGCDFCASGIGGCDRSLTAGEILLQLISLRATQGHIRNVVFMGMGEAFHNYEAVCESIDRMTDKRAMDLSPGHITVSTCGVVPAIHRYAHEGPRTELAVSLGSADQATRDRLMPGMARWDLADLMAACYEFSQVRKGQPVTFAYVMMAGVNDQYYDVDRVVRLLKAQPHHLNLIPYNEVPGRHYMAPNEETVSTFYRRCRDEGLNVSIRRSKGREIEAACGQLRRREKL